MPDVADLLLRVNGAAYGGWESISVTRGMESVAGVFQLTVTDRKVDGKWSPTDRQGGRARSIPIAVEDECSVELGGETVIRGNIDKRTVILGPSEHSLTLAGRDRAAAMVDCSALLSRWEFHGANLLTLARELAAPFGVPVSVQPGLILGRVAKLTIDPGESSWEALERACRMDAVLAVSDGAGGIVLTRAGSSRAATALVEGENVETISLESDASGRFARYVVMGQHQGSPEFFGTAASDVRAESLDAGVARVSRVLVVRPQGNANLARAQARAEWEAAVRAGRADQVMVTVTGWQQGNGRIWPINALVPVRSSTLGIEGELLITQAVYAKGPAGTTTTLALMRPDALLPEPVKSKKGKGSKGERWKELT